MKIQTFCFHCCLLEALSLRTFVLVHKQYNLIEVLDTGFFPARSHAASLSPFFPNKKQLVSFEHEPAERAAMGKYYQKGCVKDSLELHLSLLLSQHQGIVRVESLLHLEEWICS